MRRVLLAPSAMRLLTFDELPARWEAQRALIHLAAFSGTWTRNQIETARRRLRNTAEYVGVFAADRTGLLGQVFVLRIPYTFPTGPEVIGGIAAVATRPDRARTGVARTLLEEVHRLEREAGIRYCALWTNRSWIAHGLYERLGYRDLYSSPWALLRRGRVRAHCSRGLRVRSAHTADLDAVDRLHDRWAEGRLGFCRRPDGFGRTRALEGSLDPATQLVVAEGKGELVGYAHLDRGSRRTICGELVATSPATQRALVEEVAQRAAAVPLAFQHTVVTDSPGLFAAPEFAILDRNWHVLMGKTLARTSSETAAVRRFATDSPRFLCLAGDRF